MPVLPFRSVDRGGKLVPQDVVKKSLHHLGEWFAKGLQENLFIDDVFRKDFFLFLFCGTWKIFQQMSLFIRFFDLDFDAFPGSRSGESNIQLTVAEDRLWKVDADSIESLPLWLVDGHGKGQNHRELQSLEFEWQVRISGRHGHPWYEDGAIFMFSSCDGSDDDVFGEVFNEESSSIAESNAGKDVIKSTRIIREY